ncbi:MAG: PAS domain-containing protein [Polyangiaceae bacterium]
MILLSARAGDEASVEGLQAGADDYLVKPFSARELLARVKTHLQLASLRVASEAERSMLFSIFMQAPVPVAVLMGPELRYEVANPHYAEIVGRQVLGKTLRDAYPELDDHPIISTLLQVYASGTTVHDPELCVPLVRARPQAQRLLQLCRAAAARRGWRGARHHHRSQRRYGAGEQPSARK